MEDTGMWLTSLLNDIDMVIDEAMETKVRDAAKGHMQAAIITNVYEAYPQSGYPRKLDQRGLLDMREPPAGSMQTYYDSRTKTLTLENVRKDWEPYPEDGRHRGRNVVAVVESGAGYDYWPNPFPRPFHATAEQNLVKSGDVEFHIKETFERRMGGKEY